MMKEAAHRIVERISQMQARFFKEEDVRVICEHIFVEELAAIGIEYTANYEVQVKSGAIDALFQELCIEYKKAGLLQVNFHRFACEKSKYLPDLAEKYNTTEDKIYGVLFDGMQMGFFRKTGEGSLVSDGPYDLSDEVMIRFIQIANATRHKALISENLLRDLGPDSQITRSLVCALWDALKARRSIRTEMFFKEWSRLFGQVSNFGHGSESVIREAAKYGIELKEDQCSAFVFLLHTVYAIYIKHIALMILQARRHEQYTVAAEVYNGKPLLDISRTIENGSEFRDLGVSNFMEGDFFCWYISEWNTDIETAMKQLVTDTLSNYEPSTGVLKPEAVRDLLKELYQGLMSKAMRHDLGEYYTPDWMAQYTIDRSGYQIGDKILDPSCGSGTFLVLLLNRTIAELKKKNCSPQEIVSHLVSHIYGIDLNPLAVITARTNYLIAIEAYLEEVDHLEIPVYLSDAIFSPQRDGDFYTYYLDTEDFRIPLSSAMLKDFDIIVGNPPWLKWSSLPPVYRETIKDFCKAYGLFSSDKFYGGVESDVSTMVLYASAEKWLRLEGTLAMLITRSVFKTESSEGFRQFQLPGDEKVKFEVKAVHDFTPLKPFEGAVNKPALLILKKGSIETTYPVPWTTWYKRKGGKLKDSETLEAVLKQTKRVENAAAPVSGYGSPWLTVTPEELETCRRLAKGSVDSKEYGARKGICTDCNGVYYGKRLSASSRQLCVFQNNPSLGRKNVPQREVKIESGLVSRLPEGKKLGLFDGTLEEPMVLFHRIPCMDLPKTRCCVNFLRPWRILLNSKIFFKKEPA